VGKRKESEGVFEVGGEEIRRGRKKKLKGGRQGSSIKWAF